MLETKNIDNLWEILAENKINAKSIENKKFKVALSFPGEKRSFVEEILKQLELLIDKDLIFYDNYYNAQLARPNLDNFLQNIYHNNTELIVACLCNDYAQKEWCGLEWRAIKDLIKQKEDRRIMLLRFDDTEIDGLFSIDGYIDVNKFSSKNIASFIFERVKELEMI